MKSGVLGRASAWNGLAAVLLFGLGCARPPPPPSPLPAGDAPEPSQPAARALVSPLLPEVRRNAGMPDELAPLAPLEMATFDPILTSPAVREDEIQKRIDWWLEYWRSRSSASFQRGLARMGGYVDFINTELAKRDLPPSLAYLPLIEANYFPRAISHAGAAGLWQFMPHTARWLGLRVDAIVDERFDPFTATPVALDYILDLNEQFGSWFLTLAAYNAGPGRVESAIRRYGGGRGRDDALFARIRERLPSETRDFIPKYLAAVHLASAPSYYGLPNPDLAAPLRFDVANIEGAATIDVIAQVAGVEEEELERLNPHLRAGATPVGGSTAVRLPEGRGLGFAERFALIPPIERVNRHIVSAGETLTHIARAYRISVDQLRAANPGVEPRYLQIGATLAIPARARALPDGSRTAPVADAITNEEGAVTSSPSPGEPPSSPGGRTTVAGGAARDGAETVHVVLPGQSLWLVSRLYEVDLARLRAHNRLVGDALIQPGDTIRIPPRQPDGSAALQSPVRPPDFSTSRIDSMVISRSTALSMS